MGSKYSIIQFSPNAISGERINIGAIAFDEESVLVNFVSNWKRVKSFARADVTFLKHLAQEMRHLTSDQLLLPGTELGPKLNGQLIERMASSWANSIQHTTPRSSLKSTEELLPSISARFLTQPVTQERSYRDRRSAASVARTSLQKALEEKTGKENAEKFLHTQGEIKGIYGPHVFDVVIANGSPSIAVQGVSFELPEATQLDQLVDAVAFQVFDIREANQELALGILALPPTSGSHPRAKRIYKRAVRTYEGLNAEVVEESNAETWARSKIQLVSL
ncbi:MAG: DUF3037 domain-containing protein [Anaerolineales bacterium]